MLYTLGRTISIPSSFDGPFIPHPASVKIIVFTNRFVVTLFLFWKRAKKYSEVVSTLGHISRHPSFYEFSLQ
jgi:hypothetical protein